MAFHLLMKTGKKTITAYPGPGWFIENQDTAIEPADQMEAAGFQIDFEGNFAIIAAEVKRATTHSCFGMRAASPSARLQRTTITRCGCNRGESGNMNRKQTDDLVSFKIEQEGFDIKKDDRVEAFQTITTELSLVPKGDRT